MTHKELMDRMEAHDKRMDELQVSAAQVTLGTSRRRERKDLEEQDQDD